MRRGAEIAIACPGRLLDHVDQRTIDLSTTEALVLDEADRMFDMGFLPAIRRIIRHVPKERQTLLFSATMPDDIRRLASEVLRRPVTVQVGRSAPVATVAHAIFPVPAASKTALLLELLARTQTAPFSSSPAPSTAPKRLGEQLARAGHAAASIQGNLSQNRRQAALDGFRSGRFRVLVATDIAARGIDVATVSHVVNYDMPDTADAYTHRIGRTGRATRPRRCLHARHARRRRDGPGDRAAPRPTLERRRLEGFEYAEAAAEPSPMRTSRRPRRGRQPRRAYATAR